MHKLITHSTNFFFDLETKGKSHNTIKNYRSDIECYFQFLTEQKVTQLDSINQKHVNLFAHYLNTKYQSENSKRRKLQTVRIFFDYLVSKNIILNNYFKNILPAPRVLEIPSPPSYEKLLKLHTSLMKKLNTLKADNLEHVTSIRDLILFELIYYTAGKVSNLSNLQFNKIIFSSKNKNARILFEHEKRDPYSVPIPNTLHLHLQLLQKKLDQAKKQYDLDFSEILFNTNPHRMLGGGLTARGMEIIFKNWSEEFDLELTPRLLRQAGIFRMLSLKIPHPTIREYLGVTSYYDLSPYETLLKESPKRYLYVDFLGIPDE